MLPDNEMGKYNKLLENCCRARILVFSHLPNSTSGGESLRAEFGYFIKPGVTRSQLTLPVTQTVNDTKGGAKREQYSFSL